jgi:hypothetical protein
LDILAQQFGEFASRFGPLAGTLQCRPLPIEALSAEAGFPPRSVEHLTLLNLFNANLYPPSHHPRLVDPLLTIVAPGGSFFITASEANVLLRQAQTRPLRLTRLGEIQGYYDENIVLLGVASEDSSGQVR